MLELFNARLKNEFGSRRGLVRSWKHGLLYKLGAYRTCQELHLAEFSQLVFVCAGNICRSPLAEAVARAEGLASQSYGLHCRGGDPADPRAATFAAKQGLSLEAHRTRNIANYQYQEGDLVVAMEPQHLMEIRQKDLGQAPNSLAGLWLTPPRPYIHDPFNTSPAFFEKCEQTVLDATQALIQSIKSHHA